MTHASHRPFAWSAGAAGFAFASLVALAAPGDLDPAYGTAGVAEVRLGRSVENAYAVVTTPEGKLVVAGITNAAGRAILAVARYTADGALESRFDDPGMTLSLPNASDAPGRSIALQPDGRLLVAGACADELEPVSCVARYLANGQRDASFGTGGIARSPTPPGAKGFNAIALQPDGAIVAAGTQDATRVAILRFTPAGQPDIAFNGFGAALVETGAASFPVVTGIALRPDGRIVVGGAASVGGDRRFLWLAVNANGSPDATVNGGTGLMRQSPGAPALAAGSLALQPDGKVLLAGYLPETPSQVLVARFLADGALDTTFNATGFATAPEAAGATVRPGHLDVDDAGRIRLAGKRISDVDIRPYFTAWRWNADGTADAGFGTAGRSSFSLAGFAAQVGSTPVAGGALVIVGTDATEGDFQLARAASSGALDTAFGIGGLTTTEFLSGVAGRLVRSRMLPDNRMVGLALFEGPKGYAIFRRLANGQPDTSFAGTGFIELGQGPTPTNPLGLGVQADGRIVVAEFAFTPTGLTVRRFLADGTPDASFGAGGARFVATDPMLLSSAARIHLYDDGRILIGTDNSSDTGPLVFFRLTAAGVLDTSFGGTGIVQVPVGIGRDLFVDLEVLPDGRVLAIGQFTDAGSTFLSLVRLTPTGLLDAQFGAGTGKVVKRLSQGFFRGRAGAMTIQPDGRILVDGAIWTTQDTLELFVQRYSADGGNDPTFGVNGEFRLGGFDAVAYGIVTDPAGRIYAGGTVQAPGGTRCVLVALFPHGAADPAFGGGTGYITPTLGRTHCVVKTIWFDTQGAIVMGADTSLGMDELAASNTGSILFARVLTAANPATDPSGDADADGVPNGVEAAEGLDLFVRDNDIFSSARLFAMQQYRDFLSREGDAAGIGFWTDEISAGASTRAQAIQAFFASPEFQGVAAPVVRLYFAYYLRVPDYAGLSFWIGHARAGNGLGAISGFFAQSAEFLALYGNLSDGQFVDLAYRNVLGRDADPDGRAHWVGQLAGGATRGEVMLGFSESAEYVSAIANEVFATMMYAGMLRRAPEPGGFSYWVTQLDGGTAGLALAGAFLGTAEYRARFLP